MNSFPNTIRQEGHAEQVGDLTLVCTGGGVDADGTPIPLADFTVMLARNITSRILGPGGVSEALLLIDEPGTNGGPVPGFGPNQAATPCPTPIAGCAAPIKATTPSGNPVMTYSYPNPNAKNVFQGIVSANQVTFKGVPLLSPLKPGIARIFRITNLRVDATGSPANFPVGAVLTLAGGAPHTITSLIQLSINTANVSVVQPGLDPVGSTVSIRGSIPACANFGTPAAPGLIGQITFAENFGNALKTRLVGTWTPGSTVSADTSQQNIPGTYPSESGLTLTGLSGSTVTTSGLADYGTRLKASFSNIPAGARLFVSATNLVGNAIPLAPPLVGTKAVTSFAQLISNTAPEDAADSGTGPASATPLAGGFVEVTLAGASGQAVWELFDTNPTSNEKLNFNVYLAFPGGAVTGPGLAPTPSVTLSFAPTNGTANIPAFANFSSALPLFDITACPITITGPGSLPAGTVGAPYTPVGFGALNGAGAYSWTATGLPPGLSINPSGILSGTPAAGSQGAYSPQFVVHDFLGSLATVNLPLTISPSISMKPTISALSPTSMTAGAPSFTLLVNGSGFAAGASLRWNGTALNTSVLGSTILSVNVPADGIRSAGNYPILVANPDGSTSNTVMFPVVPLAVSSFSPASATAGGSAFVLTLTGSGFLYGATAHWNGAPIPASVIDGNTMSASIPASLIAAPGIAQISVSNPGGGLSNTAVFPINELGPELPAVSTGGVVNAGSYQPSVAPGSLIAIFGSNLAGQPLLAPVPLPTTLAGVSVSIGGVAAPILYVSPSQINAQVPFETPVGNSMLVVERDGVSSAPVSFAVTATGPGVLTAAPGNHAVAQNSADWSMNSPQYPVPPGQYLTCYLTGQGLVDNPVADGAPAPASPLSVPLSPVQVTVGGVPATVSFAGLAPGMVGVMQLNLLVPQVPAGDQPLVITIGGVAANPAVVSVGAH